MKYQIQHDNSKHDDIFEVTQLEVIKERTRARISTWIVATWLLVLILIGATAAMTGARDDLKAIFNVLTPLATLTFGRYLGIERSK